jgi:hypothetical protein
MTSLESSVDGAYAELPYSGQIIFTESGRMSTQARNLVPDAPDTDYTVQGFIYHLSDGAVIEITACSIFVIADGRFADMRLYVDHAPVDAVLG